MVPFSMECATCDLLGAKRLIEKDVPPAPSQVCRERTGR